MRARSWRCELRCVLWRRWSLARPPSLPSPGRKHALGQKKAGFDIFQNQPESETEKAHKPMSYTSTRQVRWWCSNPVRSRCRYRVQVRDDCKFPCISGGSPLFSLFHSSSAATRSRTPTIRACAMTRVGCPRFRPRRRRSAASGLRTASHQIQTRI